MIPVTETVAEEKVFLELRRKVRQSELLSTAVEKLLRSLHFTGRLSVVVQNGQVLKSGYEEGYFSHREGVRLREDAATAADGAV
jgi:sulfur carrier protein ThiS